MKSLFWLVAVFAAAAAIAVFGRASEGYVLFVYPPWRVEASLLLAVIGLLIAFAAAYGAVRLVHHALALPAHVRAYRARRKRERSQAALAAALQAQYEGRFARAEKEAALAWEQGGARLRAARARRRPATRSRRRGSCRRPSWRSTSAISPARARRWRACTRRVRGTSRRS